MRQAVLFAFLGFLPVFATISGCEQTRAEIICDLTCDCEHCNDQDKLEFCNTLETTEKMAAVYGCSNAWNAYTTCIEQRGTCDETEARFTVYNDINENRCKDESEAFDACISDASAHEGVSTDFN